MPPTHIGGLRVSQIFSNVASIPHHRRNRLDHDELRQLLTNGKARVANEANEIILTGDQSDDLFLAKTDFAEAILNFWSRTKLFDAHGHSSAHAAQRTKLAPRLFCSSSTCGNLLANVHGTSLVFGPFPYYTHFAICWACFDGSPFRRPAPRTSFFVLKSNLDMF